MALPLYVDLDGTLAVTEQRFLRSDLVHIRPNADKFLRSLGDHGPVFILSHATLPHVERCLDLIPGSRDLLSGIFSREDLQPVEEIVDEIMQGSPWLTERQVEMLEGRIVPIAPPGVVFDDQPVGSYYYVLKSSAIGIGPRLWIKVQSYSKPNPKDEGLARAYTKFRNTFVEPSVLGLSGPRMGAVEGWVVTQDGETVKAGFASDLDAVQWLHKKHSFSVDHAVRNEGYDIVLVRDGKVEYSYRRHLKGLAG